MRAYLQFARVGRLGIGSNCLCLGICHVLPSHQNSALSLTSPNRAINVSLTDSFISTASGWIVSAVSLSWVAVL
ncbi:MAG: hypothetical protein AAF757_30170 [Cyanobacteria bacterium P01_D01_bin.116]